MTPRRFTQLVGVAALAVGGAILVRDLVQIHSIPYAIAGIGMAAFGAWRLQVAARIRP